MLSILPRAPRMPMRTPIAYRRATDDEWFQSRISNISESGVLFGPTMLKPGAMVEVMFSTPVPIGGIAPGKMMCTGQVIRTDERGETAAQFRQCRFC